MVKKIESLIRDDFGQDEDHPDTLRTYGIGAQILVDLGVRKMNLLSAPKKFLALAGFGLEVVDYYSE